MAEDLNSRNECFHQMKFKSVRTQRLPFKERPLNGASQADGS